MTATANRTPYRYPILQEDFDLAQTLDCGQCFRWNRQPDGSYQGVVGRHPVSILQQADCLLFTGENPDFLSRQLPRYLALDEDYPAIRRHLSADPTLQKAIAYAPGIRVLRQDGWEALCSFIISQNNNIKRIKGIVERLCQCFGEELGGGAHAFPTPQRLAQASLEELAPLRSGFRAKYILDAAQKVASGEVSLEGLEQLPLEEARARLMEIKGVGVKLADCALLYGFGRVECCPTDVWIRRVLEQLYPGGLPDCALPYAGIAQQYLFHYSRTCPQAVERT